MKEYLLQVEHANTFISNYDSMVESLMFTGLFTDRSQAESVVKDKIKERILSEHLAEYGIWEAEDRGKTVWRTKLPQDGKRPKKVQACTRKHLENKITDFYIEKSKDEEKQLLTLRTLWTEWISFRENRHPKSTVDRNIVSWRKYYLNDPDSQWLLDTPLSKIDNVELETYMLKMVRKYNMTPHSFGDFRVIISKMLDYAYRRKKYIPSNPMDFVVTSEFNLRKERKKKPAEQIFYKDDLDRLIDYAWEQYHKDRSYVQKFVPLAIIFMIYTGIRLGEVVAVRFDDIEDEILYIWQSFEKETSTVQERVKKDEAREIDLIPEVLDIVEEVKRRRLELGLTVDSFIFPVDDKFMSLYKAIDKMMPKYCQELGIDRHTPHDTRRTFVSQMHKNGTPAATIMGLTGHRDYETFENSYLFDTEGHEQRKNYIRSSLVGK